MLQRRVITSTNINVIMITVIIAITITNVVMITIIITIVINVIQHKIKHNIKIQSRYTSLDYIQNKEKSLLALPL